MRSHLSGALGALVLLASSLGIHAQTSDPGIEFMPIPIVPAQW